jgi:hypothetical protein
VATFSPVRADQRDPVTRASYAQIQVKAQEWAGGACVVQVVSLYLWQQCRERLDLPEIVGLEEVITAEDLLRLHEGPAAALNATCAASWARISSADIAFHRCSSP